MSVHEILSAITEAKVALDREPQLTSRILELERSLSQSQQHAQQLELHIVSYKDQVDGLQSKVRSLEVERDDMGFRELETQDKLDMLRGMVMSFTCSVEAVMPKPVEVAQAEPVSEPIPVTTAPQAGNSTSTEPAPNTYDTLNDGPSLPNSEVGQSDTPFTSAPTSMGRSPNVSSQSVSEQNDVTIQSLEAQPGQSESPLPAAPMTDSQSQTAPYAPTGEMESAPPSPKPYEGKTYTQVFGSFNDGPNSVKQWQDGGGSIGDFYR